MTGLRLSMPAGAAGILKASADNFALSVIHTIPDRFATEQPAVENFRQLF
jgi:hypothetical protein